MKIMKNEFIPYEQALALKELGFNEECFAMFQKNKKIWYCDKNNWITNFEVDPDIETLNLHIKEYPKNVSLINGIYFLHSCANFTAPTYSQAFRWFREKYDLKVSFVYWNGFNGFLSKNMAYKYECYIIPKNGLSITVRGITDNIYFNTYEEAELECLKKLIEIVKTK
jgi:hypothetical protein